jgi:hypothetical protein
VVPPREAQHQKSYISRVLQGTENHFPKVLIITINHIYLIVFNTFCSCFISLFIDI